MNLSLLLLFLSLHRICRVFAADLCGWELGRSILVNDTLYFMGGNWTFQGGGPVSVYQQPIYSLNLSTSFPVDGLIHDSFLHSGANSQTQYAGGGAFFSDINGATLYSMAGNLDNDTLGIATLKAYDTQLDDWSDVSVSGRPFNSLNRVASMFATTESSGLGLGFMAGGDNPIPGLIAFNASDPNNPTWTNSTGNVPYFWGPATEHVRFGNEGVLIAVGGYTDRDKGVWRDMSAVQVYDIDSGEWFEVTAGGDVPGPRSSFCSGLSSAPDDSSFQMTVYGGYGGPAGVLGDIYVLTMPAFRWIKVIDEGYPQPPTGKVLERRRQLCNVYQDRQMLVLGGDTINSVNPKDGFTCNSSFPPLRMLDLTSLTWQTQFPLPNATYEVPQSVYNVIGGGPNGGATMMAPSGGFNSTNSKISAKEIFSKRVPVYDPRNPSTHPLEASQNTNTSSSGSPALSNSTSQTGQSSSKPTSPASSTPTGAIAGGVVGGVVGAALVAFAFALLWPRHRRRRKQSNSDWQKAELSAQSAPVPWAKTRPNFQVHEEVGSEVERPQPQEIHGNTFSELDAALVNELPGASAPLEKGNEKN